MNLSENGINIRRDPIFQRFHIILSVFSAVEVEGVDEKDEDELSDFFLLIDSKLFLCLRQSFI